VQQKVKQNRTLRCRLTPSKPKPDNDVGLRMSNAFRTFASTAFKCDSCGIAGFVHGFAALINFARAEIHGLAAQPAEKMQWGVHFGLLHAPF
jgi:hypothetical protein